jgi:hypothetical protein
MCHVKHFGAIRARNRAKSLIEAAQKLQLQVSSRQIFNRLK